jgi:hypothetical protein
MKRQNGEGRNSSKDIQALVSFFHRSAVREGVEERTTRAAVVLKAKLRTQPGHCLKLD